MPLSDPKLQQTTQQGVPDWISQTTGPIQTQQVSDPQALAYVDPSQAKPTINVARPEFYTPSIAAHEATHLFQNTRNPAFQNNMRAQAPVSGDRSAYNYGGVAGLQAHPLKSIGDYNHEQQAQMVQDLTQAQGQLKPRMSRQQLQQWDTTKQALERPIQQLMRVPPPDHSMAERGDTWLRGHGISGDPLERLKGQFVTPKMAIQPLPAPEAPSVALGFANRSKLVR